jgi:predicted RNase H-like HicB family nuclease
MGVKDDAGVEDNGASILQALQSSPSSVNSSPIMTITTEMTQGKLTRYVALINGTDGAYSLTVPDLPGCTSTGGTITEVLNDAAEAARQWIKNAGSSPLPRTYNEVAADERAKATVDNGTMLAMWF